MTTWNEVQANAAVPGSRILNEWMAQQQAQRAIQEANATNESLIAAMPDMLFQLDGEMRIVRYHADKPDLTVPPEAFMGKRLDEVLSARTARAFFNAVHAAGRSGQLQRLEYSSRRGADRLRQPAEPPPVVRHRPAAVRDDELQRREVGEQVAVEDRLEIELDIGGPDQ